MSSSITEFSNVDLVKVIKELYLNELAADVHFTFKSFSGKTESIPVHKCHLVVVSNVFNAMFNGSWNEKDDVDIVDASPAAFKEFLQFFYCNEVKITVENVEGVLSLGQKYLVPACLTACSQFLMKTLTNENVCFAYGLSISADMKDLKKLCEAKICLNSKEVFRTHGFLECHREILNHILQMESLATSEKVIFRACMKWVCAASKRKNLDKHTVLTHLGDSFYNIRFGLMQDQLEDCFRSHEIQFSDDLQSEISHAIKSKDAKPITFKPRNWDWNERPEVKCIRGKKLISYTDTSYDSNRPYEIRSPEISTFSTNVALLLRAIVCADVCCGLYDDDLNCREFDSLENITVYAFKIYEGNEEIENVEAYVKEYEHSVRRAKVRKADPKVTNLFLTSSEPNVIHLKKPILISPGRSYTVSLKLDDRNIDGQASTDFWLKNTEVSVENGITIKFSEDVNIDGTIRNLIYGLHFSTI